MSDQIKVAVRIRPLIEREVAANCKEHWKIDDNSIYLADPADSGCSFAYDDVFGTECTNEMVYDSTVKPIVASAMQGYNGTVFAYGQTSSGKTYTIMGDGRSGMIPMAIQQIFDTINETPNREHILCVSYLEIYKEQLLDLLTGSGDLRMREKPTGEVYVENLETKCVTSADEIMALLEKGQEQRHVGETNMNERSSRSHTIVRIAIESRATSSEDDVFATESNDDAVSVSHLNIVDLAGSERASQTGAVGERAKEGASINRSLFNLARVISQLSDDKEQFISFRDSKLTRILQTSLGGNAKTAIIANVTPACIEETKDTLNFASRAKRIKNKPVKNEVVTGETLLKRYKKQVDELTDKLNQVSSKDAVESLAMEKEELARQVKEYQEQLDKYRKIILTGTPGKRPIDRHDVATGGRSLQNLRVRRQTWCPSLSRLNGSVDDVDILATPRAFRPLSERESKSSTEEFCPIPEEDVINYLTEGERKRMSECSPRALQSPGARAVIRKRAKVNFASSLATVVDDQLTPTRNPDCEQAEVGSQVTPSIGIRDNDDGTNCANEDRDQQTGEGGSEQQQLLQLKIADLEDQLRKEQQAHADSTARLEAVQADSYRLEQQLSAMRESIIDSPTDESTFVGTLCKKFAMDPNIEESRLEDTKYASMIEYDSENGVSTTDRTMTSEELKKTPPADSTTRTEGSHVVDATLTPSVQNLYNDDLVAQLQKRIAELEEQKEMLRVMSQNQLPDTVKEEIERIVTLNNQLMLDNAGLKEQLEQQQRLTPNKPDMLDSGTNAQTPVGRCDKSTASQKVEPVDATTVTSPLPLTANTATSPEPVLKSVSDASVLNLDEQNLALISPREDTFPNDDTDKTELVRLYEQRLLKQDGTIRQLEDLLEKKDALIMSQEREEVSMINMKSFWETEHGTLKEENGHLREEIERLRQANDDTASRKKEEMEEHVSKTVEDANAMVKEFEAALMKAKEALSHEAQLKKDVEKQLATITKELTNKTKDVADYEFMLEDEKKRQASKVSALTRQVNELEDLNQQLNKQQSMTTPFTNPITDTTACQTETVDGTMVECQTDEYRHPQLDAALEAKHDLQQQHDAQTVALNAATDAKEMLERELEELKVVLKEQLQQTEITIGEQASTIALLTSENAELHTRFDQYKSGAGDDQVNKVQELQRMNETIEELNVAVGNLEKERSELAVKLEEGSEKLASQSAHCRQLEETVQLLRTSKRRLEEVCDRADEDEQTLRAELSAVQSDLAGVQKELSELRRKGRADDEWTAKVAGVEERLSEALQLAEQRRVKLINEELKVCAVEERARTSATELRKTIKELKNEVALKDEKIRHYKNDIRSLQQQKEECTMMIGTARGAATSTASSHTVGAAHNKPSVVENALVMQAREKNHRLEKTIKELEGKIERLQTELLAVRRENSDLTRHNSHSSQGSLKENAIQQQAHDNAAEEPMTPKAEGKAKKSFFTPKQSRRTPTVSGNSAAKAAPAGVLASSSVRQNLEKPLDGGAKGSPAGCKQQ